MVNNKSNVEYSLEVCDWMGLLWSRKVAEFADISNGDEDVDEDEAAVEDFIGGDGGANKELASSKSIFLFAVINI